MECLKSLLPLSVIITVIVQYFIAVNSFENDIVNTDMESELIKDYFNERDIRIGAIFTCSLEESVKLLHLLMEKQNRTVVSKYYYFNTGQYFMKIMHAPYNKLGVYLNYSCEFGRLVFSQSSNAGLFNERYVWLLTNKNESVIDELRLYNLQLDTDMLFGVVNEFSVSNAGSNINIKNITLYDLYKIQDHLPLRAVYAGFWNETGRLRIVLKDTKTSRRSDLQGITVDGTAVLSQMSINKTSNKKTFEKIMNVAYKSHLDIINRFPFIMNMNLAGMYNFTINVSFEDDWGAPMPDGSYDGMLGRIERGETILGLSTVVMTRDLLEKMDFSFPIWKFRPIFILLNPRSFGTYHALLVPFSTEVWLFVICLIIFNIILLTFIKSLNTCFNNSSINSSSSSESKTLRNDGNNNDTIDKILSENVVIIIGALSSQGLASCSNRLPERIILYMSLIVGMLLCTYYNSMVVTSLLQPPPPLIRSCEQLVASDIKIGITNVTYYKKYFEMSKDKLVRDIYEETSMNNGFVSPEVGMELVRKTPFSFYGEEATMYPIIIDTYKTNEICRVIELELISPYYLPCPYKKGSPLKQFINSGLHLMRERGIVNRERKQWHKQKPQCQGKNDVPSIKLQTLIVAYIILFSGICLSIIIFIIEVLLYKRKFTKKRTQLRRNIYRKNNSKTVLSK